MIIITSAEESAVGLLFNFLVAFEANQGVTLKPAETSPSHSQMTENSPYSWKAADEICLFVPKGDFH